MTRDDTPRRVLGFDPGAVRSGWTMLERGAAGVRFGASGVLELEPSDLGLHAFRLGAAELFARFSPDLVGVERVAFVYPRGRLGPSMATGLVIAAWVGGELAALAATRGLEVRTLTHNEAKDRIGAHAATGKDMAATLRARVTGWPHVVGDHERDAGAVALAVLLSDGGKDG